MEPTKKNSMDVYRGIIRPRTFEALAYNGNVMTSAKRYAKLAQKASKVVPLSSSVMVFSGIYEEINQSSANNAKKEVLLFSSSGDSMAVDEQHNKTHSYRNCHARRV